MSVCEPCWQPGGRVQVVTDRMRLVLTELDKVRERYTGNPGEALVDEATSWLYLLAEGYKRPEEVERMAAEFPTIEEFVQQYGIAIGDPRP